MKCPYCSTDNREDRETCYHCGKDVSMLRLIVNKARHHYNIALEHAERQRYPEALAELQNSLELDNSFVPAHVVMGTVYAKMERYEEAEKAWQEALALDPHILKAHDYVTKAETVQTATPILRKLKWALGAAAALALLFLALSAWQLIPESDAADDLGAVNALVAQGNHAAALAGAARIRNTAEREEVREAAALLERAVEQRYETAAMTMMSLLFQNEPVAAHKVYAEMMQGRKPPETYARLLAQYDEQAARQAATMPGDWAAQYQQGGLTYEQLRARLADLRQAFDSPLVAAALDDAATSANRVLVQQTLAERPAEAASSTETLAWLDRLGDLPAEGTGMEDAIASATAQLLDGAVAQLEQRLAQAAKAGDVAMIESVLADLGQLKPHGLPESAQALAETAQAQLGAARANQFSVLLSKATIDDIPALQKAIESFDTTATATAEQAQELAASIQQTRERLAEAMVEWIRAREWRFEQARLSEEDARFTVDRAGFVLQNLPGKRWLYRRDLTTFAQAVALYELGRLAESAQAFEQLREAYPTSPYLKFAEPIRERIARQLEEQSAPKPDEG